MSYMLQGPSLRARQNQRVAQELQALATQLHQNVDTRDRKYHLKNYKSCFVGSDAVTWMVASGWATSRADAVRKGRRLVRARYIHHVVNNHDFCDGLLFFRFYADEASRYSYKFWAEQSPEEAAADPRKFRFEPHTVANSLVLTVPLAKQLEAVVVRAPPSVVQGMFRVVRQRVLDVSRADGVWVKSMSLSGGGVDVYRQHVDSAYPAIKTVFEIGVKPAQYFRAWLDLNARTHLEPYLVEALHVDVVPKMQDRMSFRHIPMHDGGSTPSAAPGDSAANPGGSPTGGSAAGGDGEGDTIATAPSTGASRRSSRATTPPPRLPSRSKVPSFTAPAAPDHSVRPRRMRSRDEHNESDSDEELLSEKISRVVHRSGFLRSFLGKLVPKPRRPTLNAAHLRRVSQDGGAPAPGVLQASPRARRGARRRPPPSSPSPTGPPSGGEAHVAGGVALSPRAHHRDGGLAPVRPAGLPAAGAEAGAAAGVAAGAGGGAGAGAPMAACDAAASGPLSAGSGGSGGSGGAAGGGMTPVSKKREVLPLGETAAVMGSTGHLPSTDGGTTAAAGGDDALAEVPSGPRIVYRRTGAVSAWMKSRDYCVLQDFFQLANGTRVVYEMSVQHRAVPPAQDCVRGEIMLFALLLEPVYKPKKDTGGGSMPGDGTASPSPPASGGSSPGTDADTTPAATTDDAAAATAAEGAAGDGSGTTDDAEHGPSPSPTPTPAPAPSPELGATSSATAAPSPTAAKGRASHSSGRESQEATATRVTIISQFDPHVNVGTLSRLVVGSTLVDYQSRYLVEQARTLFEDEEEDRVETAVPALEGLVPKDRYATPGTPAAPNGSPTSRDAAAKKERVGLSSFDLLAVLGRGGYGKVMMVRHKRTRGVYAMKILRKKDLMKKKQVQRTMVERAILSNVEHPFIVGLKYAFQTPAKLYMVIDFVSGGDFFTLLTREGCLSLKRTQLYVAELALALHHLHTLGIVYRDLKPENVLLDQDGHVKLTDFGLSRLFSKDVNIDMSSSGKEEEGGHLKFTNSFCGTEQYMAPEVLLQRGHNHTVDFWCLGILMSEMLTGRHPFKSKGGNHMQTLRNIVNPSVRPSTARMMPPAAASFMRGLLQRDASVRLGSEERGGFEELMAHPFFAGLNWDDVKNRRVKPEFQPRVKDTADTSNFDDVFTREAAVDSRSSQDGPTAAKGGGLFGLFKKKSAPAPPPPPSATDDGFRGFSYVAPGLGDGPDMHVQHLKASLQAEALAGQRAMQDVEEGDEDNA